MARKRMIDPGFWLDERLGMCEPLARLLFAGLISQSDDVGRLPGTPTLLRSLIFPYDESISIDMIKDWLNQLVNHNMITIYTVDNQTYICIRKFLKHQTIKKPQPSKYPVPPDPEQKEPVRNQYGTSTEPVTSNRSEENRSEDKGKEEEENSDEAPPLPPENTSSSSLLSIDPKLGEVFKKYESEGFGMMTPTIAEELIALYDEFGSDWVNEAIKESALQNKRRLKYVSGILQNWRSEGGMRQSQGGGNGGADSKPRAAPTGANQKSATNWLKSQIDNKPAEV